MDSPVDTSVRSEAIQQTGGNESWSQKVSKAWARAQEYTRQRLANVKSPDALSLFQKSREEYLERQLDYGPPTAESLVSEKVSSSLKSLLNLDKPGGSGLLETARLELFAKASEKAGESAMVFARKKITETIYNALDKGEPIAADDRVATAQREFEMASSPGTLFHHSFPFVGGKAIRGVEEYLHETHEKFWRYFDLSTDQLIQNAEKEE
jgi:hypothetical protein